MGPLSAIYGAMSEREFQAEVVDSLQQRGWLVFVVPDMRKTLAGLPDLLCLHPGWDMAFAFELKTETGRATAKQRAVLSILGQIPGIYARIVRPSEWRGLLAWIDSVDREPTR